MHKSKKGYTLVEIGAVVTIIALIMGGITTILRVKQRSMMMSLMDDVYALKQAYDQFRVIYDRLPGDMYDAPAKLGSTYGGFTIWPGTGDGYINNINNEPLMALQHLGAAGLINGFYEGEFNQWGNLKGQYLVKATSSLYNNATMYFASSSDPDTGTSVFRKTPNSANESMVVVSKSVDLNGDGNLYIYTDAVLAMISPFDLNQLDVKFDDGYPALGRLLGADAYDAGSSTCVNSGGTPFVYFQLEKRLFCYFAFIVERTVK